MKFHDVSYNLADFGWTKRFDLLKGKENVPDTPTERLYVAMLPLLPQYMVSKSLSGFPRYHYLCLCVECVSHLDGLRGNSAVPFISLSDRNTKGFAGFRTHLAYKN